MQLVLPAATDTRGTRPGGRLTSDEVGAVGWEERCVRAAIEEDLERLTASSWDLRGMLESFLKALEKGQKP